ncbi:hypothetical protein [Litorivita sp. NS0012-18]
MAAFTLAGRGKSDLRPAWIVEFSNPRSLADPARRNGQLAA